MNVNAALNAVNSGDILRQYVGINLLNKAKNLQVSEANQMLRDFANIQGAVQAAHLGRHLDVRV